MFFFVSSIGDDVVKYSARARVFSVVSVGDDVVEVDIL